MIASMIEHIKSIFVFALSGGVFFIVVSLWFRRRITKIIFYDLAVLLIVIAFVEAYAWFELTVRAVKPRFSSECTQGWGMRHDILGYAPRPSVQARAKRATKKAVMYDVTYTIDENGQRIAPRYAFDPDVDPAIVLFGCSYTFGEGVEDQETAAYKIGVMTGLNVYNFAFNGYGPQQMLAALDQGLVKKIVHHNKAIVIYQTMLLHIPRAAGYSSWDSHSARYILTQDGSVRNSGHFDDQRHFLRRVIRKSNLYELFLKDRYMPREKDIDLYLAIIRAAARAVCQQFEGSEFHVILWPGILNEWGTYDRIKEELSSSGIRVHPITDILQGYEEDRLRFQLGPLDYHPNPTTHAIIADYICKHIIQSNRLSSEDKR